MLVSWAADAVCRLRNKGEDIVLATFLRKSGSATCPAVAKIIVGRNGNPTGFIGGWALEAATLKMAFEISH